MTIWNAGQYLRFASERTRPARDLAAGIDVEDPQRVIDLGCGPGNSTAVLAARWPGAEITGFDGSPEMIAAARRDHPDRYWVVGDIAAWAANPGERFDVVFSNAALQWVDHHAALFPALLARVAPGGALAVQIPGNYEALQHVLKRDMASSPAWRNRFTGGDPKEWHTHDAGFYYDVLAPVAARLDIWQTEYLHVMKDVEAIVEFYKGTALRPYLDALTSDADRERFVAEYLEGIRKLYQPRPNGSVLFPFRRIFIVAYAG